MSRVHRLRRHVGQSAATHERARGLAATRVDWPLDPVESAWLEAHLGSCEACRSVAAEYEADSLGTARHARSPAGAAARPVGPDVGRHRRRIGVTRQPLARGCLIPTSVDPARRPVGRGGHRRRHRRERPVGRVPQWTEHRRPAGSAPPIAVVPTFALPGATPMAVGVGFGRLARAPRPMAGWPTASRKIDKVCPTDRQPDCEPVNDRDSKQVDLAITPKSISQSPVKNQAVVVGTDASGNEAVVVMSLPTPLPTSTPSPTATPPARRRRTPSPTPEPTDTPAASESATTAASSEPSPSDDRLDRAEHDPVRDALRVHRAVGRALRRADTRADADPDPRTDRLDEPGHHLGRQGRRPVGRLLAGRCVVRVHRPPVGWLGRAGHLRLARGRPAGSRGHQRPRQRLRVVGRRPAHRQSSSPSSTHGRDLGPVLLPRSGERQRDGHRRGRLAPGRRPDRQVGGDLGRDHEDRPRRHDPGPGQGRARPARLCRSRRRGH